MNKEQISNILKKFRLLKIASKINPVIKQFLTKKFVIKYMKIFEN